MVSTLSSPVHIVGWAHSKFGKFDQLDSEVLIAEAVRDALTDAGLAAEQIDAVVVGTFNGGFVKQDFPSSLAMNAQPGLRFKPALRVENACATGSAAIYAGMQAIRSGDADMVLVVGYERMNGLPTSEVGDVLLKCAYVKEETSSAGFAGVFAGIAQKYFDAYGDASDALARIAAKNHHNAMANPYAHQKTHINEVKHLLQHAFPAVGLGVQLALQQDARKGLCVSAGAFPSSTQRHFRSTTDHALPATHR